MAMEGLGRGYSQIDNQSSLETTEMLFSKRRCCSFFPCFGSSNQSSSSSSTVGNWWHNIRSTAENDVIYRGINVFKKLREWSEIVAGPRWKTFIRRFNRSRSGTGRQHAAKFQYDPLSYALNFDEGPGLNGNSEGEDEFRRNFSSRYASISSARASVDFDKDAPSLV